MRAAKVRQKATLAETKSEGTRTVDSQSSGWCFPEDSPQESAEAGSGWQRIDCYVDEDGVDVVQWLLFHLGTCVEHLMQSPVQAPLYERNNSMLRLHRALVPAQYRSCHHHRHEDPSIENS